MGMRERLKAFADKAEVKQAQATEQLEHVQEQRAARLRRNACPRCGSENVQVVGVQRFGIGRAAVGGALLGPLGLLAGLTKRPKFQRVCASCGKVLR